MENSNQVEAPFVKVVSKKNRVVAVKKYAHHGPSKSGVDSSSNINEATSSKSGNEKLKGKVEEKKKLGSKGDEKKGTSLASTS